MGAIGAPHGLTWWQQRQIGPRPESWQPCCARPGAPRPSSPWPSRPTPAWAGPACAALGPRPSGLGRAHRHLSHQSYRLGAGPRMGPVDLRLPLLPQEARARGTGGLCRKCSPGARLAGGEYEQTLEGEASKFCRHTWKEPVPEAASPSCAHCLVKFAFAYLILLSLSLMLASLHPGLFSPTGLRFGGSIPVRLATQ